MALVADVLLLPLRPRLLLLLGGAENAVCCWNLGGGARGWAVWMLELPLARRTGDEGAGTISPTRQWP